MSEIKSTTIEEIPTVIDPTITKTINETTITILKIAIIIMKIINKQPTIVTIIIRIATTAQIVIDQLIIIIVHLQTKSKSSNKYRK